MRANAKTQGLTTAEVCDLFDISRSTLFRWERERSIPAPQRDRRKANQRMYSQDDLSAIRAKYLRGLFRAGFESEDLEALRTAQETLSLQKMVGGDLVGVEELINSSAPLSTLAIKQLLRVVSDRFDPTDETFEEAVRTVLKSCGTHRKNQKHMR